MEKEAKIYSNRLIKVADALFEGNKAEMARAMDMKPQSLNNYISRNTKPGAIFLDKLIGLGINTNWFLSGEGPMMLNDQDYKIKEETGAKVLDDPVQYLSDHPDLSPEQLSDEILTQIMHLPLTTPAKLRLIAQLVENINDKLGS